MIYIIFGDTFTFPDGSASTNRVYTYAKGFSHNGIAVNVICFRNDYLENSNGVSDGIRYFHPFGQTKRNKIFIIRTWLKFMKYINTYRLLKGINKKETIMAIHVYSIDILTQLFAFLLSKTLRTKLLVERSEHPLRAHYNCVLQRISENLKIVLETKLYNGIFCISNYLIDFYIKKGVKKDGLFVVPSTVDAGRFHGNFTNPLKYKYILYCGSLTILKDGVNILIESFAKITDKHPGIYLVLIGEADTLKEEMILKDLVVKLKKEDRVKFLGKISRNDIPNYLCNATVLALARPNSIIANAGFPSKLTEYLATGKPIVVTRVGEIPVYLKDNENAFLADPDNVESFALRLDYVLSNYGLARKIGERGKDLTATVFNYNYQTKRMIDFISSL